MSLFKKNDSYLGVDIGAHGIKLVELKKQKGRPQLWTYAIVDQPLNIHVEPFSARVSAHQETNGADAFGDSLSKQKKKKPETHEWLTPENKKEVTYFSSLLSAALKKSRVQSRVATASLPVSHIFHTVFTFPLVPEKELPAIVHSEVKKFLSRPVEEMQIAFQKIKQSLSGDQEKYMHVLVTAAPKELVAFYTAIFQRAGLHLQDLETEAFALERSLVGQDPATVMVVDIGAERTNFFIIDNGLPLTHRSIQIGGSSLDALFIERLHVDSAYIDQIKKDIGRLPPAAFDPLLYTDMVDSIVKEIEYGFDVFLHQTWNKEKRPEKIILTGGAAVFPVIANQIRDHFPMKVFVGDPWARIVCQQSLKPILNIIGPRMSVSIGLALRNILL
ncbi:MAG TPA: hypothetical protein DCY48_01795 [Candidatus Magasanikbacteria bacterium]|nr:MAG: hypothetical protein A3I74_00705 [Candidatus Magasanikbacteria bacterium RIFCSPLOWO2_02_FULL_47_16]OGH80032.1 MAG: hypothetical protein A3C10_02520 [Candidatus Magasanikbacteria bacterium RIFCSPHIGHO2_02_FULL_48_18]OGH83280.1 MAG: hypothetical protein A3G08_02525 [Candidatus Magasanikbacteria bacterium RIFCSPLOWO2_12_FULL_47_9b]HAZ28489.1 hypothetical protein [Candidatus Magasanikbacteria bacterium]